MAGRQRQRAPFPPLPPPSLPSPAVRTVLDVQTAYEHHEQARHRHGGHDLAVVVAGRQRPRAPFPPLPPPSLPSPAVRTVLDVQTAYEHRQQARHRHGGHDLAVVVAGRQRQRAPFPPLPPPSLPSPAVRTVLDVQTAYEHCQPARHRHGDMIWR